MKIRPFVSVNFCSRCGCPIPRFGVSVRTKAGNVTTTTPFLCIKCKTKKKKR